MGELFKKIGKFCGVLLYDLIAPLYDVVLRRFYRPFRIHAFEHIPEIANGAALDLACGTGQNFSFLAGKVRPHGKIIGLDLSSGMLRSARHSLARHQTAEGFLIRHDADTISSDILKRETKLRNVDIVVCSFGFSAMRDWKIAFHRSFDLLKPGGIYMILDVYAQKKTFRSWLVESLTGSIFSRETWHFLEHLCPDFQMEYIDPSAHLFGGRVFIAFGTKPAKTD